VHDKMRAFPSQVE